MASKVLSESQQVSQNMPENTAGNDKEAERRQARQGVLDRGNAIVRGQSASVLDMEDIAYRGEFNAKDLRAFSLARKLLTLIRQHPEAARFEDKHKLKLLQQHALCTYKDDDTVLEDRLREALQILDSGDLQQATPSQETLGLAGSIYKQWWRYTGRRGDLEKSLHSYLRGAAGPLDGDFGYTAINAAFVLDLIAKQESKEFPQEAQERRDKATALRRNIVDHLPALAEMPSSNLKQQWWYWATLAECFLGLGRYAEARQCLQDGLILDQPAWQRESTTRQLSALASALNVETGEGSETWDMLAPLVENRTAALRAIAAGKVGLALSGGGFRASLFHIGVLARLAELDVLRHVDVLSCVSGGSIIGAHYYLEVRNLLQNKHDSEITQADYVELVQRIECNFLAGVQKNLRTRMAANWWVGLRSLVVPGYTRTRYLGDLFEKHIFARVAEFSEKACYLRDLTIVPKGWGEAFRPKLDNWRRAAKAPILLLNATTLNTGHVWQFAATWMGEPPMSADSSVDCNDVLRRMYYDDAPGDYKTIRLGDAVAASACVPGLFDPLEMKDLYPDRIVKLVDGGVHDNQGIAGLLEQDCSVLLVSDASGQMTSHDAPSGGAFAVLLRTQNISMERIRQAEYQHLAALRRSSALNSLMFLHLKKDLEINHVDQIDVRDPWDSSANPSQSRRGTTLTSYGMLKTLQGTLAGVRTDLDSFSDAEAYALMLSGYRMVRDNNDLPKSLIAEPVQGAWKFLSIAPSADGADGFEKEHRKLRRILTIGARLPFKVWLLRPVASAARGAGLMLLFLAIASILGLRLKAIEMDLRWLLTPWMLIGGAVAASLFVLYLTVLLWRGRKSPSVVVSGLLIVTIGWALARLHLWFFDPLYLKWGRVRRV